MQQDSMWGLSVTEGIIAILFGFAAVFWPGLTIVTLLYLFAAFILISGIIALITGIFHGGNGVESWFLKVFLSIVQIGIGVYLLRHPHVSFTVLILLIGFGFIIRGVIDIVAAFVDRTNAGTRFLYIIVGALAAIAGVVVLFQPVRGGVAFVWILGIYALVSGPMIIAAALQNKNRLHTELDK